MTIGLVMSVAGQFLCLRADVNLSGGLEFEIVQAEPLRLFLGSVSLPVMTIHKHYSIVGGVNFEGGVVLEPVRVEHADLENWLQKYTQSSDDVVIESTINAWYVYDLLEPRAEKVLAANMIPALWVPPVAVRNLRCLLSPRRPLMGMHTQTVNRQNTAWQQDAELSEEGRKDLRWAMVEVAQLGDAVFRSFAAGCIALKPS